MALTIRPGTDQAGLFHSVKNDVGEVQTFRPGQTLPLIGVSSVTASTAAQPVRCWRLPGKVVVESSDGKIQMEGFKDDILVELEYGSLLVFRACDFPSHFDCKDFGDSVSRVYRNLVVDTVGVDVSPRGMVTGKGEF